MENKFRVYPRGFLGSAAIVPVSHSTSKAYSVMASLRNAEPGPTQYKALGEENPEITKLYANLIHRPYLIDNFDFRQECILSILKAFGSTQISPWIEVQQKSPYFGKYHKGFMLDMIRFAEEMQPEQSWMTWDSLIDGTDENAEAFKMDYTLASVLKRYRAEVLSTSDWVYRWLVQPTGFNSLMHAAFILFGSRRQDMPVSS